MADNSSNSVTSNVVGGIITALVLAIGGALWAFAPGAWSWFMGLLASIWTHLTSPETVPTWWLYILYVVGALTIIVLALRFWASFSNAEPTFFQYQEDRFLGAVWRWRYSSGGATGIWAFCPECDTVLVYSQQYDYGVTKTTLHCETCRRDVLTEQGDKDELVGRVHRQIDRKLRNGEWKDQIARKAQAET